MKKNGTETNTTNIASPEPGEHATTRTERLTSPAFLAVGFIFALGCAFWLIWQNRETESQKAIRGHMHSAVRNAQIRLQGDEDYLELLSKELAAGILTPRLFEIHAPRYLQHHPGLLSITWATPDQQVKHVAYPTGRGGKLSPAPEINTPEKYQAAQLAAEQRRSTFTPLLDTPQGDLTFELWMPSFKDDKLLGFFIGSYSCKNLVENLIPLGVRQNYNVAFQEFKLSVEERMDHSEAIKPNTINTNEPGVITAYLPLSKKGIGVTFHKKSAHFSMPLLLTIGFCAFIAIGMATMLIRQTQDLTKRKAIEQELVNAKKVAEEASNQKGQFLASMSHEIRTPMTAILGYLELIADSCPRRCEFASAEIHGYIDAVQRNGHHLMELINSILDLSKIEAGKIEILNEPCSLPEIISDVVTLTHPVAERKGLKVSAELLTEIPDMVTTDAFRLRQILVNLIGNAIKFTQQGSINIKVGIPKGLETPYRKMLFIEVEDTGIGIPSDRLYSLFAPFSQAESSTDRKFGGTGLGLTISRMLARMLGGDLTVKSVEGNGSVFTLTIAIGIPDHSVMLKKLLLSEEKKTNSRSKKMPTLHSRILLAEDGIDNQRLISTLLCKLGAKVTIADNGQKAVEEAITASENKSPFDLILMDMQMPILDGYGATQKLRSLGYEGPIIALTANAMSGDRQKCIEAGCDDYLRKPIESKKLFAAILHFSQKERILELTIGDENSYNPVS